MAADDEGDRAKRSSGLVPYGLLSPGVLWLALFFLVPLVTLALAGTLWLVMRRRRGLA